MQPIIKFVFGLLAAASLAACAEVGDRDLPPERVYVPQRFAATTPAPDGSIYSRAGQESLLGQERARAPGDLITILIDETMSASSSTSSVATRNSKTTALTAGALGTLQKKFGSNWPTDINPGASAIDSQGTGTAEQAGKVSGSLTAVVTEVLPNGLLVVRGYKRTALRAGSQVMRVTGLVRPSDIQPDNTVRSRRLADAEISVAGRGELVDASRSGWMNRALLRIWPF